MAYAIAIVVFLLLPAVAAAARITAHQRYERTAVPISSPATPGT